MREGISMRESLERAFSCHKMDNNERGNKLVSTILILLCSLATCNANCTFVGPRTPKDKTRLQNLQEKRFSCEAIAEEENGPTLYSYTVGICTSADQIPTSEASDAGAMQRFKNGSQPIVLGKYTLADFREGDDWLMLEYFGGQKYRNHCSKGNRTAVIMVQCTPGEEGRLTMIEESNNKTMNCFYLFELKSRYGCSSQEKGLSVGSIIVIVFLSLVAVYLLFGLLFQRFVKGAKGLEQIPNYTFWRDAGNLAADGCDLVFRSHSTAESREYRGVGGDTMHQEITRDTTSPDDHLLSM